MTNYLTRLWRYLTRPAAPWRAVFRSRPDSATRLLVDRNGDGEYEDVTDQVASFQIDMRAPR